MSLPSELILHICSFVQKKTLKALRLASKMFHDMTTPLLFNCIFVSFRLVDYEVAELVASRFPNLINTLTISVGYYTGAMLPTIIPSQTGIAQSCRKSNSHAKQAKHLQRLYSQLEVYRQRLHDSGAVRAQILHLLNTLPNLREVEITDRRRRQGLPWIEEISLRPVSLFTRIRYALANVPGLSKKSTPQHNHPWSTSYRDYEDALSHPDVRGLNCVEFNCLSHPQHHLSHLDYSCGLSQVGSQSMPWNPWEEIMMALQKSPNGSIRTVSIHPASHSDHLPFATIDAREPHIMNATHTVLGHLTRLELHLDSTLGLDLGPRRQSRRPTGMLFAACNLESLTIGMADARGEYRNGITAFDALLGGCQLPRLLSLYLHNLNFQGDELCAILRHSPDVRDVWLSYCDLVEREEHSDQLMRASLASQERLPYTIEEILPCPSPGGYSVPCTVRYSNTCRRQTLS